jgi:hypothetical protein
LCVVIAQLLNPALGREKMKKPARVYLVLLTLLSITAFAQDATKPVTSRGFSKKAVSISGTLSDDGKFFLADPDAEVWRVANPDLVKAQEGHRVTMQAQTNAETSEIRVLRVKTPGNPLGSMTGAHDAAFRR